MPELEAIELAVAGHAVALSQWHVVRLAAKGLIEVWCSPAQDTFWGSVNLVWLLVCTDQSGPWLISKRRVGCSIEPCCAV